jgi:hypothetical protein
MNRERKPALAPAILLDQGFMSPKSPPRLFLNGYWIIFLRRTIPILLVAICANGFGRASLDGLPDSIQLFRRLRLVEDVSPASFFMLSKHCGRCFHAKLAIDA